MPSHIHAMTLLATCTQTASQSVSLGVFDLQFEFVRERIYLLLALLFASHTEKGTSSQHRECPTRNDDETLTMH